MSDMIRTVFEIPLRWQTRVSVVAACSAWQWAHRTERVDTTDPSNRTLLTDLSQEGNTQWSQEPNQIGDTCS